MEILNWRIKSNMRCYHETPLLELKYELFYVECQCSDGFSMDAVMSPHICQYIISRGVLENANSWQQRRRFNLLESNYERLNEDTY